MIGTEDEILDKKEILSREETTDIVGRMKKSLIRQLQEKEEKNECEIIAQIPYKDLKCYVNYETRLQRKLQIHSDGCPLTFITHYYKTHIRDGVLLIKDGEQAEEFLREIYENLNALLMITTQPECWEAFSTEVYEQSGLIIQYGGEQNWQRKRWEGHYLFDFAYTTDEKKMYMRQLPKEIQYVDFMPSYEKQRVIEGKRKDITYIPCPKCLDTCQRCGV